MRKLSYAALSRSCFAARYVAYPFFTAWSIREAMRERRCRLSRDEDRVGQRAREPAPVHRRGGRFAAGCRGCGASAGKPGLWQRLKMSMGRRAVDGIVDKYVTPEGLPQLFGVRNAYREVSGEAAG